MLVVLPAQHDEFISVKNPWNHELSGNFRAKSCARVTLGAKS